MAVSFDILEEEQYNVFRLYQISSGTFLKDIAGVDYLEIPANSISEIHRHHESDAILFVISGSATADLGGRLYELGPGVRVIIPRGTAHGFQTNDEKLQFVSVQVPPIQNPEHGVFDLEVIDSRGQPE